jgi:methionyl-tRNA formyltransferase
VGADGGPSAAGARPLTLAVAGAESAAAQVIRLLVGEHRVRLVLASASPGGSPGPAEVAAEHGIAVAPPELVRRPELAGTLRKCEIDLLLNVHSLYILDAEVLAAPRLGAFNLHPGLLPEYAGLSCPSWAIYNGETEYGVSVHRMTETIDAGHIAYQSRFGIRPGDTGGKLSARCVREGVPLVLRLVQEAAETGTVPAVAQDLSRRTYYAGVGPDPRLDWSLPADRVAGHVRAADYLPFRSPWPDPHFVLEGRTIAVLKAAASGETTGGAVPGTVDHRNGVVRVAAADEWVEVWRVKVDGTLVPPESMLRHGTRLDDSERCPPSSGYLRPPRKTQTSA